MRRSFTLWLSLLACACASPGSSEWRRDAELGARALNHGRLAEAEPALAAALARAETFGAEDPRLAGTLNLLGDLRMAQNAPTKAEPLYRRALAIQDKTIGPDAAQTSATVAYLSEACAASGKGAEAAKLLKRAAASAEKDPARGPELAARLSELAALQRALGRDDDAVASYRRSLAVTEKVSGPESRAAADLLSDLAQFHQARREFAEAGAYYERSLAVKEKILGAGHPETEAAFNDLALFYESQDKLDAAEAVYKRALAGLERAHGKDSPRLTATLGHFAHLERRRGRTSSAAALEARAKVLAAKAPKTAP